MRSLSPWLVVAAIVLLIAVLKRHARSQRRQVTYIENPRVSVASLGEEPLIDIGETDANVYTAFFPDVEMSKFETTAGLLEHVGNSRPDILHLYCALNEGGELTDVRGGTLGGGALLEACRRAGVRLLYFASDNPGEHYRRAFAGHSRGAGGGVDLVCTLERRGENFPSFLGKVLGRMSKGDSMPMAWVKVAPQAQGPWMDELPSTVYMPNQ